jgi:hypothetical protein
MPSVLDKFRNATPDAYEGLLRAQDVPNVPDYRATIAGFAVVNLEDGAKVVVVLEGGFGKKALVLNRRNGRTLARVGNDVDLIGATVLLSKRKADFRGHEVDSLVLEVPPQSHP